MKKKARERRLMASGIPRSSSAATWIVVFIVIVFFIHFLNKNQDSSPIIYSIDVVKEFPHDRTAFTQGLLYSENDTLFESTGLYGKSSVRKVALQSGEVLILNKLEDSYFGEGLTLLGDRLFQLTWMKSTGFVYHHTNLTKVGEFSHKMGDGWGLSTDGRILYGSDGSSTLYRINPLTMEVLGRRVVRYGEDEVHRLNELEFINGEVWANIWQTDCIARISPKDGMVIGWILLHKLRESLLSTEKRGFDVLNGIAYDQKRDRIFVTGKWWPKLYQIKLRQMREPPLHSVSTLCLRKPFDFS